MIIKRLILSMLFVLFAANANSAMAQTTVVCGERNEIIAELKNSYNEKPDSIGLKSDGSVIEIFASDDGQFTLLVTQPIGISCVIAIGINWEKLPRNLADLKV